MGKFHKNQGKFNNKNHNKKKFHTKKTFNKQEFKKTNRPANYTQDQPKVSLREDQVGITEYVNKTIPGFNAVIKSRYSDFHVNEIGLDNKVLILNDLQIPKSTSEPDLSEDTLAEARENYKNIITEDDWSKIEELAKPTSKDVTQTFQPIEININELDKEKRTEIHNLFKKFFAGKLVSTTINKDDVRYVRVQKAKGGREEKREKWTYPGDYVKFLVHKENMDTTAVSTHMARNLKMQPSNINYCGTKDKRAITTQMFCVKRRKPTDILASIRGLRNVRIGNFSFGDEVLKLGQLRGNRFRLALRHIVATEVAMEQALKSLKQNGFINYFGMQRFGNCADIPTYEIGVALMKADYKNAVELILKPRNGDLPWLNAIRETWWKNRDAKEAAEMFHNDRNIEKKLLDALVKCGDKDYATALRQLPRNLLLLYPHALQSLIFNRIASKRIEKYGLQVLVGDLVFVLPNDANEEYVPEAEDLADNADDENAANNDETIDTKMSDSFSREKVRTLTSADISSGNYSIYDVVLPLPGFEIQYPENELSDWYKETLEEYGLSSDSLNHNIKTFKLSGAYRKLLVLPLDLSWEFCCYDKSDAQLIRSDWDLLKGIECQNRFPIEKYTNDSSLNRALILEFSLPSACYATMMLRELLKIDTSSANQCNIELQAKALKESAEAAQKAEDLENAANESIAEKDQPLTIEETSANQQKRKVESNVCQKDCEEMPADKIARTSP